MTKIPQTNVYAVCDCSGSMVGEPEHTMRELLRNNIKILADAEVDMNHQYEVTLVPFSGMARKEFPLSAGELLRVQGVEVVNTDPPFGGTTALLDAIGLTVITAKAALAAGHCDAALVMVFTDGAENASVVHGRSAVATLIKDVDSTGRFTITFAGPQSAMALATAIGIPAENCRPWDGSAVELRRTDAATQKGLETYTTTRSTGATRGGKFYADASQLTATGIKANTKAVVPTAINIVTRHMAGRTIADYFGGKFQQGKHFYELVKAEYIQEDKDLVVFIKSQNEYRLGSRSVRTLLSLPETGKIRVHPSGNASDYTVFVRSESVNRKVVEGQQLLTVED